MMILYNLICFKSSKSLNISIWPMCVTETDTTTPGNDKEGVLNIAQTPGLEPHH